VERVKIIRVGRLPGFQFQQIREAQLEAGRIWNQCRDLHLAARKASIPWPGKSELQVATKGKYALHSQTVQMICHSFLANVETTKKLRKEHPEMGMKYPWRDTTYRPLVWPKQAVNYKEGRVLLPMGRGRKSLVLKVKLPEKFGSCRIVWNSGYELHVCYGGGEPAPLTGLQKTRQAKACVDLGEIHQAAVVTDQGTALIISTRKVVDFCQKEGVTEVFVGNPHGVRKRNSGRHHNQRMSGWEYGVDIRYIKEKCEQSSMESFTGSERGTSSQCPSCGRRRKVRGREWTCRSCDFIGHRDVVGGTNMFPLAFGKKVIFPVSITYLRAGSVRKLERMKNFPVATAQARSSRADSPLRPSWSLLSIFGKRSSTAHTAGFPRNSPNSPLGEERVTEEIGSLRAFPSEEGTRRKIQS